MLPNDDEELVTAWQNGSSDAFALLFKRYYIVLCEHAYSFLRDSDNAKDIVQQVFTSILSAKLFKNIKGSGLKAYLYTAVTNRCLRELDSKKRHDFHHIRMKRTLPYTASPMVEASVTATELYKVLNEVIEELPKQRRRAVKLYYLEGLKKMEVAEQMGIGIDTVKTHLQLALATLRQRLKNF